MQRRRASLAALALALALVAGCSDPEPKIGEDPSDPASSSGDVASTDATDPTDPTDPATEPSTSEPPEQETAEAFIRRFADISKAMQNTGETAEYLEVAGPCDTCVSLAEQISGYYAAGGSVRWGGWSIRSIRPAGPDSSNQFRVRVDSAPTKVIERAGSDVVTYEGGPSTFLFVLTPSGSTWVVADRLVEGD